MPSKEVMTFRVDMTAPMTLLSRLRGAVAPVERAMRVKPAGDARPGRSRTRVVERGGRRAFARLGVRRRARPDRPADRGDQLGGLLAVLVVWAVVVGHHPAV